MYQNQGNRYGSFTRYFVAFIWIIISNIIFIPSVFAQDTATCHTEILKLEVAKANAADGDIQPKVGWVTLQQLPDYWDNRWGDYNQTAWYKIIWKYTCPNKTQYNSPITLVIENINMAGEIYLNDQFLWKDQSLTEPMSRSWLTPRYWILPGSSLNLGQNTLLIKVVGTPTQKSGLGPLYLGEHTQMNHLYKQSLLEKRTLLILSLIINFIIGIFCLMVWVFNRTEIVFKWFAVTSLAWSIYLFLNALHEPLWGLSSINLDRITMSIFCFYTMFGCIAAWRFANKQYPKIEMSLCAFCVLSGLVILFMPDSYTPKTLNLIFTMAMVIFLFKCISYPFIAYQSKLKEAYILAIQYLLFIPIAINDAIFMVTLKGQILSPYVSPISTFLVGFILALRLSNNAKSISDFNKTLAKSIVQAKSELSQSLNAQHQLALDNAKLQQRIDLSHDLHDGLGGSIVRSMSLLDHHHLSQQQMLSILKLLRSDLRQVIDYGSSVEAKTPETPILWVASIRRRFIQIFEDMDIESNWNIPTHWLITPPPLYCLTLLRVAEEALTNVIKHSQASIISVNFLQDWDQHLILEIIDNGIGFDSEQNTTNISIGLMSMRVRIQRLGGLLEIQSQPGQTVIRATLNLQRILNQCS